jgi:hypothetical protein
MKRHVSGRAREVPTSRCEQIGEAFTGSFYPSADRKGRQTAALETNTVTVCHRRAGMSPGRRIAAAVLSYFGPDNHLGLPRSK